MTRDVILSGPGGSASYRAWLTSQAATWQTATAGERAASQRAAWEKHVKLNQAPPQPRAEGDPTVLLVYDEIGYWGISAEELVAQLREISGDLELHLNTPGGSVFDGIAIANALKQRTGQVAVIVDGLAASIGSVIAMAASPGQLLMAPNSTMMIHEAWGMCVGAAADMAQMAGVLDQLSGNVAAIYAARSGKPAGGWRDTMKAESWMIGQQAVDAGLADAVLDDPTAAPSAKTGAKPKAAAPVAPWSVTPTAGRVLGIESMPLLNKAIATHHTATADETWDGPAAVKAMPSEYADLHYCHAWQSAEADSSSHTPGDGDEDDKKSNFKFPHHKTKGGPANLAACRNGLARLDGADIPGADRPGVKAHLQAHLDDASKTADDHTDPGFGMDPGEFQKALKEAFA